MERYLRVAAPVGGGALVVSLIVGMFAGVSFGTVLLRALVSGVVFAAIGAGATAIAQAMLPGLVDAGSGDVFAGGEDGDGASATAGDASGVPQQSARTGSRLNIVVDDSDDSDDGSGELVEEVEEQSAPDEQAVMSAAISEEQDGTSVEIDDTMLDEMPDIGSFAGAFVSSESTDDDAEDGGSEAGGDMGPSSGGSGRSSPRSGNAGQGAGQGFSPETIAKALRTAMERDSGSE